MESKSAMDYKLLGNQFFKENKFHEAITSYTQAIQLDSTQSVFFANRANCYAKLKEFNESCKDSTTAIELDDKNIKAHLICGKSLAELGKKDSNVDKIKLSISKMTKALTLCAGQSQKQFEKQLQYYILRAKKLLWYKENEIERKNLQESLNFIQDFLNIDKALSEQEKKEQINLIKETLGNPETEQIFEIPDYFKCPLTNKLFDDPITISSGYTYEKKNIEEYIQHYGYIDPQTKNKINMNQFYPNVNLKQGIEQFLEDNPWAFEFTGKKENYLNIEF